MKVEQRGAGEPVVEAKVLGQITHSLAGFCLTCRSSEDARLAARRSHQTQQDLDGSRLARTVRPQKAENFTRLDRQVQPVKRDLAAVLLAEADGLNRGCWVLGVGCWETSQGWLPPRPRTHNPTPVIGPPGCRQFFGARWP
jgi:hypothetical protein